MNLKFKIVKNSEFFEQFDNYDLKGSDHSKEIETIIVNLRYEIVKIFLNYLKYLDTKIPITKVIRKIRNLKNSKFLKIKIGFN